MNTGEMERLSIIMDIVIIGEGKIGATLTEQLSKEGHNITVIDNNPKRVEEIVNLYDVMGLCGNGASYDIQMEAGVNKARLFISASSSDELNILSCLIAKKIGARHTIARVRSPEYSRQMTFMKEELGISMLVNPEYEAANEISRVLRFPSAIKIDSFAKGRVDLAEVKLNAGNPLDGLPVSAIHTKYQVRVLICAVQRGDAAIIPNGEFVLQSGDKIHITASRQELSSFLKMLGIYKQRLKNVMIVGGGKIAFYLTQQLIEAGYYVKIIENNEKRCIELSELLPKAQIIWGDGTDQDILLEEGLEQTDALVSLTGIDEENIIISMFANTKQVDKIVTKVNRISYDILNSIGLETVVSPKLVASSRILRYVRDKQHSGNSSMQTLYKLVGGKAEAMEFNVTEESKCADIPFKQIQFRKEVLVACIIRGNKVIFPGGEDRLLPKDTVIIVTAKSGIQELDDILL